MRFLRTPAAVLFALLLTCSPALASPLVSGNGFGFAVVSPIDAKLTKFYAHPYSFARPDPNDPLSEGIETTNFIKSLSWGYQTPTSGSAEYVDDSQLIRAHASEGEGLYYMPFGLHQTALVISWKPNSVANHAHWIVEWSHPIKEQKVFSMPGGEVFLLKFEGVEESLLLVPLESTKHAAEPKQLLSSSRSWALVSIEGERDLARALKEIRQWQNHLAPKELAQRELDEVERWRVKPGVTFTSEKERHLWRQSEILLRVAQSREPNRLGRYNNGMIVACLPDGSWSMTWARDMAYAALAFTRMGHHDEARAALLAYFNARPTGKMKHETNGADYQVSVVRYFGDGSEEPFFTNEGNTNIEFDDWGLALWVLGEYVQRYDDPALLNESTYRGKLYESARDYVVKPLIANLEEYSDGLIVSADTSIWEEHQKDKKHFAYSTAMAIVSLREFAEVARRVGDEPTRIELLEEVTILERGFNAAFVRGGTLHGTLEQAEKNDIDGALLAVINLGVVTRQEFLFVDFSLAEVHRRLGHADLAAAMLKRIVGKAAEDHNFVPEMYVSLDCKLFHGAIGDPTGAIPMVGYGAGVYILDLLQRADPANGHYASKSVD